MGYDFYQRDALGRTNRSDHDDLRYFRASVRGMPVLRRIMLATGVLDATATAPELPPHEEPQPLDAWLRATEGLRAFRAKDLGRVPLAKFRTNDAWVVTPSECEVIAASLKRAIAGAEERSRGRPLSEDAREHAVGMLRFVRDWIGFQQRCSRVGGYEVW